MSNPFFDHPILNSPYKVPARHWEVDKQGQPTQRILEQRRSVDYVTPIPPAKKRKPGQATLALADADAHGQEYEQNRLINQLRYQVAAWRDASERNWQVTPTTATLLKHWRTHEFSGVRPFFCQVEAVETVIWLTEVAPRGRDGKVFLDHLKKVNQEANPELMRLALKLATGAGKTTVMAMLIAWQTANAVRDPKNDLFTTAFLIVAPGITIRDRLQVLAPEDPNSYYASRELVPVEMVEDVKSAKVAITNFHQFKLREKIDISKGGRALLQGHGAPLRTLESEGDMLQRAVPKIDGLKNIFILNDEAHHCYREKPRERDEDGDDDLKGDDRKEAEKNTEAARLWISGLEAVKRKLGVARVVDLSATPFFLSGSGYTEGTLFPWTMSDFSLMDAIECGIVKLPRVPVADNIPGGDVPMYRNLWAHIRAQMPKAGRSKGSAYDPQSLPPPLLTALDALYGHYEKTFERWQEAGIHVPPCFIVVCNNTSTSKLVYDYVSGFQKKDPDGSSRVVEGHFPLFRNSDTMGNALARPRTLLIDSEQLESGEALDDKFRAMAGPELEQFRRDVLERGGKLADELRSGKELDDSTILREVMNTVGKTDRLGAGIRCVVSVSMLTEGWDTNTVTHVLGVRAFGTQLLCEQVIGRALRRQSYDVNAEGLFDVEYADVLGIPFDFTAKAVVVDPPAPRQLVHVMAIKDREALEITFPRVKGYRVELPEVQLEATFNDDSTLVLTPDLIGATETQNSGIIGERADLSLVHTGDARPSQVVFDLTRYILLHRWRDAGEEPNYNLFNPMKRVAREWLDKHLVCKGGTFPAQLKYQVIADMAADRITAAIRRRYVGERPITVELDPFEPTGTTSHVNFTTTKTERWQTDARRSHVNWVILDSDWEAELCRVVERHPRVRSYVKNHSLGFFVPYQFGGVARTYRPDFIVRVEDGRGEDDLLNLVVEIKGYRGEDAKEKKSTMETFWVPGVNHSKQYGRWAFAELRDVYSIDSDFKDKVEAEFDKLLQTPTAASGDR